MPSTKRTCPGAPAASLARAAAAWQRGMSPPQSELPNRHTLGVGCAASMGTSTSVTQGHTIRDMLTAS